MENVIPRMKNMLIQARKVITQPYPPSGGVITILMSSSALILYLVLPSFEVISESRGCFRNNAMILQNELWVKLFCIAIKSKNEKCSIPEGDLSTLQIKRIRYIRSISWHYFSIFFCSCNLFNDWRKTDDRVFRCVFNKELIYSVLTVAMALRRSKYSISALVSLTVT